MVCLVTTEEPAESTPEAKQLTEWYTDILLEAGERLRLPQETTATAIVLFHRFFARRPYHNYKTEKRDIIVTTCMFLAAKVEEHPRRIRDVINTVHYVRVKHEMARRGEPVTDPADPALVVKIDKHYWEMKEKVVDAEQLVLRVLGFDLSSFQHYRVLLNYGRSLRCSANIISLAWVFISDCLPSPSILRKPPPAIVCAAIYMGNQCVMGPKVPVLVVNGKDSGDGDHQHHQHPSSSSSSSSSTTPPSSLGTNWWELFDVQSDDMFDVCNYLLTVYENSTKKKKPPPVEQETAVS